MKGSVERAAPVEAQHRVDVGGELGEVDTARIGEIARRESSGDGRRLTPQPQGPRAFLGLIR
ncbi:MAG TPA: hypothetical protein VEQ62_05515, partial [Stellaceae bacterium]|nr:hypothetical protein [Stellaceae bacterium]